MKKIKPVVSVCVLTYNHEKFIKECIDSILKQKTNFFYEVIIGDDGSTDMTQDICQNYKKKYSEKIKLIFSKKIRGW